MVYALPFPAGVTTTLFNRPSVGETTSQMAIFRDIAAGANANAEFMAQQGVRVRGFELIAPLDVDGRINIGGHEIPVTGCDVAVDVDLMDLDTTGTNFNGYFLNNTGGDADWILIVYYMGIPQGRETYA